jgi:hypothetical protein
MVKQAMSYSKSETDIKPINVIIYSMKGKNSFLNAPNPFLAAYTCFKQTSCIFVLYLTCSMIKSRCEDIYFNVFHCFPHSTLKLLI